jgi:hypothetical protein
LRPLRKKLKTEWMKKMTGLTGTMKALTHPET